jgi:hypothetical protein
VPTGIGRVVPEPDAGGSGMPAELVPPTPRVVRWETRTLSTLHSAEGADAGDIDGDGVIDLVAGPTWYKGPDFGVGGTLMPNPPSFSRDQYSTFFLTFVDDVDGDGALDVLAIGDAGGANGSGNPNAYWYRNPGPGNLEQAWVRRPLYDGLVANESPAYADVTGDKLRELVFVTGSDLCMRWPSPTSTATASLTSSPANVTTRTPRATPTRARMIPPSSRGSSSRAAPTAPRSPST